MLSFAFVLAALAYNASARTFTVKNSCSFTVWPAVYTDPNVGHSKPDVPTGWEASPGSSRSFSVPDDWTSGRIWGRTGCDAEGNCASGSCAGGIVCDPKVGTGQTPASLAEWTLSGNLDFYDVSLVDGYNLPMSISNNVGCPVADCAADLLPACPSQLSVTSPSGSIVGCKSSCGWDGNTVDSGSCCTGSHGTPQTCPASGVKFYSYFKKSCPNSYVFAYDEASGTALWTCDSSKTADYTLTFCPNGSESNQGVNSNGASSTSAVVTSAITHPVASPSGTSQTISTSRFPPSPTPSPSPSTPATVTIPSPPPSPSPSNRRCKSKRSHSSAAP